MELIGATIGLILIGTAAMLFLGTEKLMPERPESAGDFGVTPYVYCI